MSSDEAIWQRFMAWLPDAPPLSGPRELFDRYHERNLAAGLSAAEAEHAGTVVQRLMQQREDAWPIMFDNIYSGSGAGFSAAPNALLTEFVGELKPGRALDVGVGQGRNSVLLATEGWKVTGFDVSERGLAVARTNAQKAGVAIDAIRSTEAEFDYGTACWELIVFMYEPFAITTPGYIDRLARALAPEGHLVVESFSVPDGAPRPASNRDRRRAAALDLRCRCALSRDPLRGSLCALGLGAEPAAGTPGRDEAWLTLDAKTGARRSNAQKPRPDRRIRA